MLISFFRSSSYNAWSLCQQQYFLCYVLGIPSPSGKRAIMGTVFHKVCECLAHTKNCVQDGTSSFEDDALGKISVTPAHLDDAQFVEWLFERAYAHYTFPAKTDHVFKPADKRDIWQWLDSTLAYDGGIFDPRLRTIVSAEPKFEFEVDEPWAGYNYVLPSGQSMVGNLKLKGTIDLVTKVGDGHYETVDWKGLPVDTPLPTPTGWTTMGEVAVGDIVFDQYGEQCCVVGKSQAKEKQCYTITFDDASSVTCDDEHLWKLADNRVVSVKDLIVGDKINVAKPLVLDEADLPINLHRICRCWGPIPIPMVYKRASRRQRIELLSVLFDHTTQLVILNNPLPGPWMCYCTTDNIELADDIVELLRSMGQSACYLHQQQAVMVKHPNNVTRAITSIEKVGIHTTQCIKVDSPDNTYLCTRHMIPTHNTGECKDWGTGKAKTWEDFCVDPQLRMYHLALRRLYPDIQSVTMTINYVRTAGPFTVAYDETDIDATLQMLRKRFEVIKRTTRPKLKSPTCAHWFCQRVCHYGKTPHPKDPTKSICQYIAEKTRRCGMERVMLEETEPGFTIGHYQNPGE